MPQPKVSRKQPEPARKFPWIGIAAAVLVVVRGCVLSDESVCAGTL